MAKQWKVSNFMALKFIGYVAFCSKLTVYCSTFMAYSVNVGFYGYLTKT